MRLSEKEALVLGAVEINGNARIPDIARATRMKAHSVSYTLKRLEDRGILSSPMPMINTYPIGLCHFGFFIKLQSANAQRRQLLIKEVKDNKRVVWAAEIGGSFHYAVSLSARDPVEAHTLFRDVSQKLEAFAHVSSVVRLRVETYGRKYLSSLSKKYKPLWYGGPIGMRSLENLDREILLALQEPKTGTLADVARRIKAPLSTVLRHVRLMEEQQIITGYYRGFDSISLGIQTFNIHLHNVCGNVRAAKVQSFAQRHPNVVHLITCLGSWDYELVVEAQHISTVTTLIDELSQEIGSDFDNEILPVFNYLKYRAL